MGETDYPNVNNISLMNRSLAAKSLPEVSTFHMSQEEALQHLGAVLQTDSQLLHARDVRHAWSSYLQLVVEPAGWLAVLIPSQDTANTLGVAVGRRGAKVVEVRDVNCDSLEAEVELLQTPGCLEGGDTVVEVPVDELYPVKNQEYDCLNMAATVVALDLIRFFYKHIWMPWDNDSDCQDWPAQHLNNRIALHFSLAGGVGDRATAIRLEELAHKAEVNRTILQDLEDTVGLGDDDSVAGEGELSYQVVGKLYQLHQEQDNIRREAELLENPLLRLAVTSSKVAARKDGRQNSGPGVLLVWGGGKLGELGELVGMLGEEMGKGVEVQTYPDLQHAVDVAVAGDTVVICTGGEHMMRGVGGLVGGGKILGWARGGKVILTPGDSSNMFIGVDEGKLEIRDLDLEMVGQKVGVMVRGGELVMENVTLTGGESVLKVGGKGKWQLKDCKVQDGGVGLDLGEGSEGGLVSCVVEGNKVGINVRRGGVVRVEGSYVSRNKEYGVTLQCDDECEEGVWEGEAAVKAACQRGVEFSGSELGFNTMGDLVVLEEMVGGIHSPSVEKTSHMTRRFSTPLSTVSHSDMQTGGSVPITNIHHTPIPHTTRVLTYFPGDQGSPT